ncbi:MAG: hypothetical protein MK086_05305 [Flavobacteriales bacterium]|nr:hypothetical protein [Flavobacteriales bacterium]
MNRFLFLLFFSICFRTIAQDLPTEPKNGFAFPIGSKFTIRMHPIDSINFDYSIIKFEAFNRVVNLWNHDSLFQTNGENGTIEFYFCYGSDFNSESEPAETTVLLIMKNWTPYELSYESGMQLEPNGAFVYTSNFGSHPGAKGTEVWRHMVHHIGLSGFKRKN